MPVVLNAGVQAQNADEIFKQMLTEDLFIFRIDSEWDLGIQRYYLTPELAMNALLKSEHDWEQEFSAPLSTLLDDGMISIETVKVCTSNRHR